MQKKQEFSPKRASGQKSPRRPDFKPRGPARKKAPRPSDTYSEENRERHSKKRSEDKPVPRPARASEGKRERVSSRPSETRREEPRKGPQKEGRSDRRFDRKHKRDSEHKYDKKRDRKHENEGERLFDRSSGPIDLERYPDQSRRRSVDQADAAIIEKHSLNPGTMLAPLPVVLVTCQGHDRKPNMLTIAWTGIVCSDPPLVSISVRSSRHSYKMIRESGEFVINVPSANESKWVDKLGVLSGREYDKAKLSGLTYAPSKTVAAPIIMECPVHLECRVEKTLDLGSHTMFIARILNVQVTRDLIDSKGRVAMEKAGLIAYAHGFYYRLGKQIGRFGFSVKKKKKPEKRKAE